MTDIPFHNLIKLKSVVLSPRNKGYWDSEVAANPRIRKWNKEYLNFYTGYSEKGTCWGIGLACSKDLMHWTRPHNNLLVSSGDNRSWNCGNVDGAWVLQLPEGRFVMFYEGRRRYHSFETQSFGLAFSHGHIKEGWKEHPANPIFKPTGNNGDFDRIGLLAPLVYRVDGSFWMFYSGYDGECMRTGLAFSDDLLTWRRFDHNPILNCGPPGSWDQKGAVMLNIFRVERRFFAFYEGLGEDGKLKAGLVTSEDLITWDRVTEEPLLQGGSPGSFDEKKCCSPYVFIEKGKMFIFFGAHPVGELPGTTGLATAELATWAMNAEVCFDEILL